MYFLPEKRKVVPLLHALNNLIILALVLVQIVTGLMVYQNHVLNG
jgi:hypothetical protein